MEIIVVIIVWGFNIRIDFIDKHLLMFKPEKSTAAILFSRWSRNR